GPPGAGSTGARCPSRPERLRLASRGTPRVNSAPPDTVLHEGRHVYPERFLPALEPLVHHEVKVDPVRLLPGPAELGDLRAVAGRQVEARGHDEVAVMAGADLDIGLAHREALHHFVLVAADGLPEPSIEVAAEEHVVFQVD